MTPQAYPEIFSTKIFTKGKRGIIPFYVIAILIAVAIIAIIMITIFVFKGKGVSLIDQVKDLFKGVG